MSQEIIDRLRAGYEAFKDGAGPDPDLLAPDFEVHQASSIIDTAGVFRGGEAIPDVWGELNEAFDELAVRLVIYEEQAEALAAVGLKE